VWTLATGPLCALAAHAVVYRSLLPDGEVHRYLAWYEPLVGALSLVSIAALAVVLALAATGRPAFRADASWSRVAATGVAVFCAQESLEASLHAGAPRVAAFHAVTWVAVIAVVGLLAAAIVAATRAGALLVRFALRRPRVRRTGASVTRPLVLEPWRRRNPLADRRALRAPPLTAF
jgi:hypothetical protein